MVTVVMPGVAIATSRPRSSSTGMRSTPGRIRVLTSDSGVPSETERKERLAIEPAARVISGAVSEISQRRTSPSDRDPVTVPCSSTRKTMRDWLALIFCSAARIGS